MNKVVYGSSSSYSANSRGLLWRKTQTVASQCHWPLGKITCADLVTHLNRMFWQHSVCNLLYLEFWVIITRTHARMHACTTARALSSRTRVCTVSMPLCGCLRCACCSCLTLKTQHYYVKPVLEVYFFSLPATLLTAVLNGVYKCICISRFRWYIILNYVIIESKILIDLIIKNF